MMSNKTISQLLTIEAYGLPETCDKSAPLFELKIENMTIRCKSNREALLKVAAKFKKGPQRYKWSNPRKASTRKSYSSVTFENFVIDGEIVNAITYNELHDKQVIWTQGKPPSILFKQQPIKDREGFFTGRPYNNGKLYGYNVFHVESGLACSSPGSNVKESLGLFAKITGTQLDEALKRCKDSTGFQFYNRREHMS